MGLAMSHESRPGALPGSRFLDEEPDARRLRPVDALLFGLFVFDRIPVGPLPFGVALAAFLVAVAVWRKPRLHIPNLGWLTLAYVAVVGYLAVLSEAMDQEWHQRALRFLILYGLAWTLASGRFHFRSAVVGLSVTLGLNIPAYYAGLTSDIYPPYLTGFLVDKNVAGMWYAVFGALGLMLWRRNWQILIWIAAVGATLFATGSRTSMSAFAVAVVWAALRNRLPLVGRLGLAGLIMVVLESIEQNYARVSVFSDRDGTDWFRSELDAATLVKLQETPWYGRGLTEAWVWYSPTRRMWVHDSFAGLYLEGGVIILVFVLVLFVLVGMGLLQAGRVSRDTLLSEAALAAVLVSAWKLGEVFFTSVAFLALGGALALRYGRPLRINRRGDLEPVVRPPDPLPGDLLVPGEPDETALPSDHA